MNLIMTKAQVDELIEQEGDYKEFEVITNNNLDFKCVIKRHESLGHLNGYVYLTKENDFYGVHMDDLNIKAHGGITFTEEVDDFWVIGIDCAHSGDYIPINFRMYSDEISGIYRDMNYVSNNLLLICEQISIK